VEEPSEDWEQLDEDEMDTDKKGPENPQQGPQQGDSPPAEPTDAAAQDPDAMDVTMSLNATDSPDDSPHTISEPLPIRKPASGSGRTDQLRANRSPSPSSSGAEGPITPRNNAGPWVFDGSAGQRAAANGNAEMRSLNAAAEMDVNGANQSDDSSR
jgi:hypothetical protein